MNRRTFLAALATASAGCASNQPAQDPTTTTDRTTTDSSTPTTTSTTESTTETTTTTTAETTTTKSPADIAARQIETATTQLKAVLKTYAGFAGSMNATLLSVDATTTEFDLNQVESKAATVESTLSDAKANAAKDQHQTITKLEAVRQFFLQAAYAQAELVEAYTQASTAQSELHEARWNKVNSKGSRAKLKAQRAQDYIAQLESKSSPESTTVFEALTKETYKKKHTQLEQQADALATVGKQFQRVESGTRKYDLGVERYTQELYAGSKRPFKIANQRFSAVQEAIKNQEQTAPVSGMFDDLDCYSNALSTATKQLRKAAKASGSRKHEKKARKALKSCGLVKEILGELY